MDENDVKRLHEVKVDWKYKHIIQAENIPWFIALAERQAGEISQAINIGLQAESKIILLEAELTALRQRCEKLETLLITERGNNIRLQIRAEDCGSPKHNFPIGQPPIDRSINEEKLANIQIRKLLSALQPQADLGENAKGK